MNFPKRVIYTYRRKSDGHIYQANYTHSCVINKFPMFIHMATNRLWKTIKVERDKINDVVINRTSDLEAFKLISLNELKRIVVSLGIELELGDTWETNGWQCDWWWKFNYDDLPFVLSGGLFLDDIMVELDTDELDDEL